MTRPYRRRRITAIVLALIFIGGLVGVQIYREYDNPIPVAPDVIIQDESQPLATDELNKLETKDMDPKTGYSRDQFGKGWVKWQSCDTRQRILGRDLTDIVYDTNGCTVLTGTLNDPYTGQIIDFKRGTDTSSAVQIDHVVALANAWQTGAQQLDEVTRTSLANDDLNLLAVDGPANMQKGAGDASAWLPSNKPFRCTYVARQIAVKVKYTLWVTIAEYNAMENVLSGCPGQRLPAP